MDTYLTSMQKLAAEYGVLEDTPEQARYKAKLTADLRKTHDDAWFEVMANLLEDEWAYMKMNRFV